MNKIKIGQIGIGHNHGAAKMEAVRKFPEIFEVVGFAESDQEWLEKRGGLDAYKGLKMMSEDELLSVKELDAVLVETDVWNLVPTAQRCIDAGVHIHMDKPAGEDIAEYEKLLTDAKAKSLMVQLGYMYRYNPAVKRLFEIVKNGELGEIFAINAEMSTQHDPQYREWLKHYKGGTMYIFGCHLIDLIISLLGKPEDVVPFNKKTGFNSIEALDNCFAVLDYKNTTAKVTNASVEVNGWGRRQLVVCGSKGTVEIKPLERPTMMTLSTVDSATSAYADCKEYVSVPETEQQNRYDEMILDFAKMIKGEIINPYTYEHELLVQKVLLKACGFENINF